MRWEQRAGGNGLGAKGWRQRAGGKAGNGEAGQPYLGKGRGKSSVTEKLANLTWAKAGGKSSVTERAANPLGYL